MNQDCQYVDIHTHKSHFNDNEIFIKNIFPEEEFPLSPFSIGQHPWYNGMSISNLELILTKATKLKQCYAIGEIGLDKMSGIPFNIQQSFFEFQVDFAVSAKLPVIIHNVKSTQEILNTIKGKDTKFIFHGFTGNVKTMKQIVDNGYYVSFGQSLMHHKATMEAITQVPANSFFLETDNSEYSISEIYKQAICLLNNKQSLFSCLINNFTTIFPQSN